eukprot:scaffold107995_cov20-Tisochrysis_lutea.AAC.1
MQLFSPSSMAATHRWGAHGNIHRVRTLCAARWLACVQRLQELEGHKIAACVLDIWRVRASPQAMYICPAFKHGSEIGTGSSCSDHCRHMTAVRAGAVASVGSTLP